MSDRLTRQARESVTSDVPPFRFVPPLPEAGADVTLADKYDLSKSRIFVSGAQAVVRTLLTQAELDRRSGLRTAGFVSGYRGSPLGRLDTSLSGAAAELAAAAVTFEPGLNEDLAATAIWGTQQAEMRGEGRYDGVFSLWYGKGPGVDRSCDALRHANLAGTSPKGGVIALMGDDHLAESSTTAHQSEFIFAEMMMPVLSPANVQEIVDYGLLGFAMSRFTSTWTGIKCVKDTVESTASIDVDPARFVFVRPTDFIMPPGGLSIRARDAILDQDERLTRHKFAAVLAFLRANKVNRIVLSGGPRARFGIVTSGKAYLDVRHALDVLGIDEVKANLFGLRLYKLGCPWPLEPQGLRTFAGGLETIMVVEEKRGLIEQQLREQLYDMPGRPVCIGKNDELGAPLFPPYGALDANEVAIAIGRRLLQMAPNVELAARLERLERAQIGFRRFEDLAARTPHFCSGCPHSGSTRIPEGARAYAGIGCHYMAQGMDRATEGYTHMGGEGANWIGEAPFSTRRHVFQNLGDGTYNHSGSLAIRFAVAAGTNITYKILFNDAVAMTGGQQLEGQLTVDRIAAQCAAEQVAAIAVVTDDVQKYPRGTRWPKGTTLHPREELDIVQRRLADTDGVTILIFDQTCAAEKRRRRKRGQMAEPDLRVVINEAVCEGCGDCGTASNCVSLQPVETEFGRKRTVDQTACNKDLTCVTGFCPAIVTVKGAKIRRAAPPTLDGLPVLPPRPLPPALIVRPFSIVVAGVGGTGVVTIAAILGMAAHIEGKGCGILDMAGLAQKGGNVVSYVKLAETPDDISALRVGAGEADLVLGCDLVAAASRRVIGTMRRDNTATIVNTAPLYPGEFTRNPDYDLPVQRLKRTLGDAAGNGARFLDATHLASTLLGSSLATNMFLLGYAWQNGLLPLSETALEEAIRLNGESVDMNIAAFAWGRRAAAFPDEARGLVSAARPGRRPPATTLDEIVALREEALVAYQNAALAARFRSLVDRVRNAETAYGGGSTRLTEAVAKTYFKLLAVKDEYEVARLYTNGDFNRQLDESFEGGSVTYHLASPFLARRGKDGRPQKRAFGPWLRPVLAALAAGKVMRGSRLDPFGYTRERRIERQLATAYERLCETICTNLTPERIDLAVELAELPQSVRGFGHVKEASYVAMKAKEEQLLDLWQAEPQMMRLAAE